MSDEEEEKGDVENAAAAGVPSHGQQQQCFEWR